MITKLPFTFVAAILGLARYGSCAATIDVSSEDNTSLLHIPNVDPDNDGLVAFPFHELIECLYTSDMMAHWLTSQDNLELGIASELDDYLGETFAVEGSVRSDNLHVTLVDPTDEFRGFLRQSGGQEERCSLGVELSGNVVFNDVFERIPPSVNDSQHLNPSLEVRRTKIYSRVARSISDSFDHLTTTQHLAIAPNDHRDLALVCPSDVQAPYVFSPNEFMCSPGGPFFFGFRADGDLGIWKGWRKVWSAGTHSEGTSVTLQLDGNLVVRDGSGAPLYDSKTNGPVESGGEVKIADNGDVSVINAAAKKSLKIIPRPDNLEPCNLKMKSKDHLQPSERICSRDERFSFGLSSSGDLGIWFGPKQVWSARTCCQGDNTFAHLQADGNFVVRGGNGDVLWESGTNGVLESDSSVTISNAGIVKIINSNAGKTLTIEPSGETHFEQQDPIPPLPESCVEQVSGRIDLPTGQFICSPNGKYRFGVALSGDLQLLDGSKVIWSAGTCCAQDGVYALLQEGDGNLVVRNAAFESLWKSGTNSEENAKSSLSLHDSGTVAITNPAGLRVWAIAPHPVCIDQVTGEYLLLEGQFICSSLERFRFGVVDGDLSLWDTDSLVWSAGLSYRSGGVYAHMQGDGNMVVRNENHEPLWTSKTSGNEGASLLLDENGVAKILSTKGTVLWSVNKSGNNPGPPPPTPALSTPKPTPRPSPRPTPVPSTPAPVILKAPPVNYPCLDPVVGRVTLSQGDFFCSASEKFKFGVTSDGDLALFEGNRKIWSANTCCTGQDVTAKLQVDGNLVVSTASDEILWTSQSSHVHTQVASLLVGDDGVVTVTDTRMGHVWSSAITSEGDRVTTDTLEGKVMAGYQGWFFAKGDGGLDQWIHWGKPREVPGPGSITIDAWPDLRELDDDELYPTRFEYNDGSNAGLYSAYNTKTVERHAKWMKEYGMDGVFVQRFIGTALAWTPIVDKVLGNVRSGAEKYGRTFVTMYDIGNGDDENIVEDVINDWKHLVDDEHITKSKQYLRHRGRPLVAIWGFGFNDRLGDPQQVTAIINWFKYEAEDKYKATLMGGVPAGWRDLSRDSKTQPAWETVYRSYDVISPWAVGRMVDIRTANYFRSRYIEPDLAECKSLGIDYLPVVFPGFSFNNLKPKKPFNEIPRNGGTFMWHQMYNAVAAGNKMIYVAMFDEVDEATAIFKIAANQQQTPTEGRFLTSSQDPGYSKCPGDWYLNMTGTVAGFIRDGKDVPLDMPAYP